MNVFKRLIRCLRERNRPEVAPQLHVAAPAIDEFVRQADVARQELVQQRVGTRKESNQRQRVLEELELELRLLRVKRGKAR